MKSIALKALPFPCFFRMKKFDILIVDDSKVCTLIARKILLNELSEEFYGDISTFLNPLQGLDFIKTSEKENLVVLLDINMPEIDGWTFLDRLESMDPDQSIRVFMVTSSILQADRDRAYRYERVIDFFVKPLSTKHLESMESFFVSVQSQ